MPRFIRHASPNQGITASIGRSPRLRRVLTNQRRPLIASVAVIAVLAILASGFLPARSRAASVGSDWSAVISRIFASRTSTTLNPTTPPVPPDQFWRTDGTSGTWTGANWSAAPSATGGTAFVANGDAQFTETSSATFATVSIGNVTVADNKTVTVTQAGTLSTNNSVRTFDIGNGATLTWTGQAVSDNSSSGFIKNGSGTWNIGSQANNYTGGFTLNAGTVIGTGAKSFGTAGMTINGGTLQSSGSVTFAPAALTVGGDFTFAGTGNATFGMPVALGGTTRTITNSITSGNRILNGVISGNAGVGLTFSGSGLTTLGGLNTYTGNTTINGGIVNAGSAETAGTSGPFGAHASNAVGTIILGGGTFQFSAANTNDYSGRFSSAASQAYNIDTNGQSVTFATPLTSSSGILTKLGAGTLTLSGANTFTGGTTIKLGALSVPTGGSISHSGADMVVGNLSGDNGALTISGGTVSNNNTYISKEYGAQGAAVVSSGTWNMATNLYVSFKGPGSLTISGGTVTDVTGFLGHDGSSNGTATVSGGVWDNTSGLIVGHFGNGTLNITDSGVVTANGGAGGMSVTTSFGPATGTLNIGTGGVAGTLNVVSVSGGSGNSTVNFNHTGAITFAPQLTGSLKINKSGAGTTSLSASNTYTGATTVNAGTLLVNGSTAIGSAVTVNSTGTLGGTGTVNGAVTVNSGGTVAPGTSPGILNTRNISFAGGSNYSVEIGGTTPGNGASNHDQLNVTGSVSPNGATLTLASFVGFTPAGGQSFTIINNDSTDAITTTFAGLSEGATITNFLGSGLNATISYVGGTNSNDVVLTAITAGNTISGTVFSDKGVTNIGIGKTVKLFVNGGSAATTTTNGSGQYSFSSVTFNAGDVITVFVSGATEKGATVTLAPSPVADIMGLDIYRDSLIARHENAGPISNGNLNTGNPTTDGDLNAIYTVAGGTTLNVAAGKELRIPTGELYTPGGDVTTTDLFNAGTFSPGSSAVNIGGVFTSGGTFVKGTSNVNYNQQSDGQTVTAVDYATLSFSNFNKTLASSGTIGITNGFAPGSATGHTVTGSTIEYHIPGAGTTILPPLFVHYHNLRANSAGNLVGPTGLIVDGTLELIQGTFTSASDYHDVTIDSGATLALSGPITVSGNWINAGTFTPNGFGVTFDGTGAQLITTGGTGVGKPFAGFTVNKSSGTATLAGNLSATALNVTAGTLDQGASFDILSGAVTVGTGATWRNLGTGDVTLSGNVANGGTINFNANGAACEELVSNDILLRSSNATQRIWSGAGTFLLVDVDVAGQTTPLVPPPAFILVRSGTNSGNNGTGWLFDSTCLSGTYTWIGNTPGVNTDWQVPTNWTPTRTTTDSADILLFDGGVTPGPIVTNVPMQTIAALRLINGVFGVTLSASTLGAQTLTLSGATGTDLSVPSGTLLTLAGANGLTISLTGAGSQGAVGGQIIMQDGAHRLIGSNAGEILFASGSIFTTSTGFTGNPFGTGTNGSVVFDGGSSAFFNAGLSPFGGSGNSVVVFNLGSSQTFNAASAFSSDGRTYGHLTLDGGQSYAGSGSNQMTISNNLTIGTTSTLTLSPTAGGDLNLLGNFTDNNQNAGVGFVHNNRTVKFQGGNATQTVMKSNAPEVMYDVLIAKTAGPNSKVSLGGNTLRIDGALQFNSSDDVLELGGASLLLNGTVSGAGGIRGDLLGSGLEIGGTGALGTLRFVSGGEMLHSINVNRTSSGSVDLGSNLSLGDGSLGGLGLANGVINTGAYTLTHNAPGLSRTNGYVIGNLQKNFGATGSYTFHVGTLNAYSPLDANVTAGAGNSLTVKAVQGQQPNISGANALQRYWTLSGSGITANLTFHYSSSSPNDIVGTEANYKIFKYDGSFTQFTPDATGVNSPQDHFATLNGVSSFSDWTLAEPASVLPDLALTKSDSQDPVTVGNSLTYTLTVTNNGSGTATNVTATDTLPANVTFVSASSGCSELTGTVTCNFGTLAGAANATKTITVAPTVAAAATTLSNTASVTSTETDVNTSDNSDTETTAVIAATCVMPPSGMVAWYPGDGNANDIQGPTFENGTLQGGATFATGKVNQAFSFDGVSAKVATSNDVLSTPTALTMDAWVKPGVQSANRRRILSIEGYYVMSVNMDGTVECIVDGEETSTFARSTKSITDGAFHHVACTSDGSTTRLYVDGVPDGTASENLGDINSASNNIVIGNNTQFVEFYNGLIDEVEIFTSALTGTEIANIYNASSAGKCRTCTAPPSGMVSWYAAETNANDLAGTNNGTFAAATYAPGKVGQAFSLDGVNDNVSLPNIVYGASFSVDAWIKTSTVPAGLGTIVDEIGAATNEGFQCQVSAEVGHVGQVRFYVSDDLNTVTTYSAALVNDNVFHHVACVKNGNTAEVYVDGVLSGTGDLSSVTGAYDSVTGVTSIGAARNGAGQFFQGLIDEVEIFSRTLSQTEIAAIANAGYAGKCHTSTVQFAQANTNDIETNSGSHVVNIAVTRDGANDGAVDVTYTVTDGTATTADGDYLITPATGTLHWNAGDSSPKNIPVTVNGDIKFENHELVNLTLSSPVGATLGTPNPATLTISNDDAPPSFSIDDVTHLEGDPPGTTSYTFTVTKTDTTGLVATVDFTTLDNTAKLANNDYQLNTGSLSFGPTELTKQITVLVNRDSALEPDETFFVQLSNPGGATISDATGVGTIQNDDAGPNFTISDVTMNEGDSGQTNFVFTVTKNGITGERARVDFATANGTTDPATGGAACGGATDYISQTGTLFFRPAETTMTVTVPVCGETTFERDETFFVNLTNPNNASIADPQGVGTILNDECTPPPTGMVSWWPAENTANDIGGPNNGTFAADTYAAGKVGQAFSFDGVDDVVVVPDSPSLDLTGNQLTMDGWIRPVANTTAFYFGRTQLSDHPYLVYFQGATPAVHIAVNTVEHNTGYIPPLNTWTHLALVYDGTPGTGTIKLYANGTEVFSAAQSGNINDSSLPFNIGNRTNDPGTSFNGLIDEVELFNRALSQPEIAKLADASAAGKCHTSTFQFSAATYEVTEGNTTVTITVTRNGAIDTQAMVDFATSGVSATSPADYDDVTGTLDFMPGQVSKTFDVTIHEDNIFEGDETVGIALSNPTGNATLGTPASATLTIHDNDTQPNITIGDLAQVEGSGGGTTNFAFTVSLSNPSKFDVNVTYTTQDNTAKVVNSDYALNSATLLIPANSTSGTITVLVNADAILEPDETFFVNLTGATGGTITDNQGIGTIQNDDTGPTFSISNVTMAEGAAGETNFVFTVTKTGTAEVRARVDFATANGTTNPATGGATCTGTTDYRSQSGTLSFPPTGPGSGSQTISVPVCGDTTFEPDETFFVNLSNPNNATIPGTGQGLGIITGDDPRPSISINDVPQNEGNGPAAADHTFTVSLSNPSTETVTVGFSTANGTPNPPTVGVCTTPGVDYEAKSGTVTFSPGDTSEPITIKVCGDNTHEQDEQFVVNLATATNSSGISDAQGLGTITNDDPVPVISISDPIPTPPAEGNFHGPDNDIPDETIHTFTVSLFNPSDQTITVDYATANGTTNPATAPSDYTSTNGTLTFLAGEVSKTVTVVVKGDTVYELNETFFVNLSNASTNATIGDGQGLGTIINDDAAPTLSINDRNNFEGTVPSPTPTPPPATPITTTMTFTVNKAGSTAVPATVHFSTASGGANPATAGDGQTAPQSCGAAGIDYISQNGTLTFPASGVGSTSQSITIVICKDSDFEPDETFFINLSAETNATLSDNQGVGTIKNDDIPTNGFVVTTTDDFNDGVCAPAPGHCSLREAINAANSSPTAVAIRFAIPANDLRHFYYADDGAGVPNGHVTHALVPPTTGASDDSTIPGIDPDWNHSWWSILPTSPLPTISQQVFIEGYTQPGATVNTLTTGSNAVLRIELNGDSAGANVNGLTLTGGSSTLRGLAINRFKRDSGAATPAGLGLDVRGSSQDVVGNFIGTDVSGTLDLGNGGSGIVCASGGSHTIGGTTGGLATPEVANLISGNDGDGISVTSISNLIQGNWIGTAANGTSPLGNSGSGIGFSGAGFNTVGIDIDPDTNSGERNTIAFNTGDGVLMATSGVGNSIRGNSIHSNGSTANTLGIDLGADGVTVPDPADADSGPNNLQNYPEITVARVTGSTRTITGTLNSTPNAVFTIDFYQSTACDTSGNGEGKTYITSITTDETDANGNVAFTFNPTPPLDTAQFLTATATSTGATFSTSEFSQCTDITDGSPGAGDIVFRSATYTVGEAGVTASITVGRDGGSNGSVTATFSTVTGGTATAGSDYTTTTTPITYLEGESDDRIVTVPITNDGVFETNETVFLSLGATGINATRSKDGLEAQADPHSAVLTINDNDTAPTLTISDVTMAEGNSGTTSFIFTVTKTGSTEVNASVNFATAPDSATSPSDFAANSGTLTFVPTDSTEQFTVLVTGELTVEPNEKFFVNLSNATNATIGTNAPTGDGIGEGTITNDDTDVTVAVSPSSVTEDGAPNLVYTFTRTGVTSSALTVSFSVAGTAAFNTDYTQTDAASFNASSGTVTFGAGASTAAVTINPATDSTVESDETVILTVTSGTDYNASPTAATGTIANDDTDVTVAVSPSSVTEDGAPNLVYTFTRNGVTTGALTVNFSVAGTAAFSTDYTQTGAAGFNASSGTVTFVAGASTAAVTVDPATDTGFESNETVILTVTSGTYNVASPNSATGTILNDDAAGGIVRFSAPFYNTTENSRFVTITVERVGDTSAAITVDYATPDDSEATTFVPCSTVDGSASPRCDFTTALGTLRFAAGETSKTFNVLISQDNYVEGPESLALTLSNLTGGAVFGAPSSSAITIADDLSEPSTNPIDDAENYVRQQYHDFLNREPDAEGLAFWANQIIACGTNQACIDDRRVHVSAAFYLSIEFQGTGYLVERLYKSAYGDFPGQSTCCQSGTPTHTIQVPIVRFSEFLFDSQEIGRGVIVGQPGWETTLENNKAAFAARFVERSRFTTDYPLSMPAADFVDELNTNAGNPLSPAERDQLVNDLSSTNKTRAEVLRAVAEDQDLINAEFNRAFVLMQYFGYLRRNPDRAPDSDHTGYDFWLTKLNQFNGNFVNAEMVKAFISSIEYRRRSAQ